MNRVAFCNIAALALLLATAPAAYAKPGSRDAAKAPARARTTVPPPRSSIRDLGRELRDKTLEETLATRIKEIWASRDLRRGTTAIYVVDALTGEPIYAVHEDERLNPASNVKLIATATALDALGADFRYATRLLGPTPDAHGTIAGDVYLLGNYDPTLSARRVAGLAEKLAERGVRRIAGGIVVGTDDRRDSVGAPRVRVTVRAGAPGEAPAVTVEPATALVEVKVTARTTSKRRYRLRVSGELVEEEGAAPRYVLEVSGTIRRGLTRSYRRSVKPRVLFTGHLLRSALLEAGIEVTGDVSRATMPDYVAGAATFLPVELARTESATLGSLCKTINKRSVNWLADAVIATVGGYVVGGAPSMEKGVVAMERWLRDEVGIEPGRFVIDTGSGLSYKTELTARQIVAVMRVAGGYLEGHAPTEEDPEHAWVESLAVGGYDGTLRSRFRGSPARGKVLGKTGTLTRVIALSGVVSREDDSALAFALVTNGHTHSRRNRVRHEHERLVEVLYDYLGQRARRTAARQARAEARAATAAVDAEIDGDAEEVAAIADDQLAAEDVAEHDDEPQAAGDAASEAAAAAP